MDLRLLSVNCGAIGAIGTRRGAPLLSAIAKRAVAGDTIDVGRLGLAGDVQANRKVHGGPDKAVYAYPADHWPWWQDEHGVACAPGRFGENLTLAGADETAVHIGDRFVWGEVELEISQPRSPCFKFQTFTGRKDAGALMTASGRCGWYFRVLREGTAPCAGPLVRVHEADGPSVREAFLTAFDKRADPARRHAVAASPSLAEAWRAYFA